MGGRQVAASAAAAASYAAPGMPPGVFLGAGLAALDAGRGVEIGSEVSEEHPFNLLGMCADPITGEALGRPPIRSSAAIRTPVAWFDLTFSPSKSISTASALADAETKERIAACDRRAIEVVLTYAEREVFHSRSGKNGVVQEDVEGVVATAFTHFDSRVGDPQLHDHVVVANRARSVSDGRRGEPEVAGRVPVVVPRSARRLAMAIRFGPAGTILSTVGAEPPTS